MSEDNLTLDQSALFVLEAGNQPSWEIGNNKPRRITGLKIQFSFQYCRIDCKPSNTLDRSSHIRQHYAKNRIIRGPIGSAHCVFERRSTKQLLITTTENGLSFSLKRKMQSAMRDKIEEVFIQVFLFENGDTPPPKLDDSTILLESGLDSLGFATFVMELEAELGFDPFSLSEEPYYPRTFGELVKYYVENAPK